MPVRPAYNPDQFRGVYVDPSTLASTLPNSSAGDYVYVVSTGTNWYWDTNITAWKEWSGGGGGTGDVVGPASAADNAVARYDTTTGKLIQDSLVIIDDTGSITLPALQTVDGRDLSVDGSKLDGIESGATADQVASEVPFTPVGTIAATDVQAMGAELDSEKAAITHTFLTQNVQSGLPNHYRLTPIAPLLKDDTAAANYYYIGFDIGSLSEKVSPISTDKVIIKSGAVQYWAEIGNLPGGSGEVNTASNVGSGAGVFKQKATYDLELRSLVDAGGGHLSVVQGTNDISFDIPVGVVDNTLLANMAQDRIKGRVSSGSGDPEDLTGLQTRNIIREAWATLTYAASITPNAALGSRFELTLTGNATINVPTNLTEGQVIVYRIRQNGTGGYTVAWHSDYRTGQIPNIVVADDADITTYVICVYHETDTKMDMVSFMKDY